MRDKWIKAGLAVGVCFCFLGACSKQTNTVETAFQDDPAAHQLYREMMDAMRKATTLSWTGDYRMEMLGRSHVVAVYRIWLKKPNYARVEMTLVGHTKPRGILVGDGDYFWRLTSSAATARSWMRGMATRAPGPRRP